MTTIQAERSDSDAAQANDTIRPLQQLSPYDLAGIRNRGSAASAVDMAGWLRRLFLK
ncbi:hypothetical protein SAMN05421688_3417 [Poseidonocella pacifica]|uniref:Uncharacterized protein n=1 Tax=Poseidonocella pacifica TaxID=871651 RepID=A0A1I0YZ98_9RHOB|nr:hypothetical protein [Poseidonocella pacifica]SFB17373.1 hypothetical protein SAMN05421688_3417 [Poseidonocella pacifica]